MKPAPVGGKGVALTARQALQASEKATGQAAKPAPVKPSVVSKAKEIAVKAPVKAPVAKKVAANPVAVTAPAAKAPLVKAPVAQVEVPVLPAAAAANAVTTDKVAQDTPTSQITSAPETEKSALPAAAEGTKTVNDVIENTKKYTDEAKTRFQSAFADMNEKAKSGVEKSTKAIEEMADIAKGNVEAIVESGKIAAKGVEAMGQDAAEYGRLTFEKASATMKSLAAVKSPTEFFQLQSEMLSSAFDAFAKESAKTSEALIKLAGEVAQPISSRVSIVTDKVKSLAA
ncbi:phasin [Sphingobium sp. SCG-1]|uniref:phasin family protein n=1 Tax=Sphingobium sp. SCG-1 TaxID=2072936 RepID=UPI000CD6A049|nr:phasin family protein [Sphingobium sp. SCG-1]AUW60177.1 phasin [Sphingobium sp. SCG-1]